MKKSSVSQVSFLIVFTLLLTLFVGTPVAAQEPDPDQRSIASVTVRENVIAWQPQIESAGFVLTISGPGDFYLQREYRPGDRPTFSLKDGAGAPLPDGTYTYELLLLPLKAPALSDDAQRGLVPSGIEPLVLSGTFSISGGRFVTPDITESTSSATEPRLITPLAPAAPNDQVILDDLIVDGSACIGFDCYNGESFGFDTLRLKENNLRIKFQDTSTSASFPSNDWQITANDSSNGGANKFSIDDIDSGRTPFTIEAGTRANALYIDDSGRVGLGTSTPAEDLHIWYGDTPTIRLHQSGSGWAPQTWDMAGNEANFFIRDVTNGSELPFRIQPGAPSDSLTIKSGGYVGIGTWSPDQPLHVYRSDGTARIKVEEVSSTAEGRFLLTLVNNGYPRIHYSNTDSGGGWNVGMISGDEYAVWEKGTSTVEMRLDTSGNLTIRGSLTQGSDVNTKEGFAAVNGQEILATLADLPITSWNFKSDSPDVRHLGPTAQDFYRAFGLGEDELHIAPLDAASVALVAIQSLDAVVAEKDAQIRTLQEQNAELQARLSAVEQAIDLRPAPKTSLSTILPWLLCAILLLGVVGMMSKRRYSARG